MDTTARAPWPALADEIEAALLGLPADGLLELLLPGVILTASWAAQTAVL
ncbi:MAG: hypothetical protein JWN17_1886, partial [Frankiales bacterium]|nr:hypothetical protein [Frankiales bacterium]